MLQSLKTSHHLMAPPWRGQLRWFRSDSPKKILDSASTKNLLLKCRSKPAGPPPGASKMNCSKSASDRTGGLLNVHFGIFEGVLFRRKTSPLHQREGLSGPNFRHESQQGPPEHLKSKITKASQNLKSCLPSS